ncbi:MAG: tetratricopeptide repeat protein [Alcanivoracaceae bacterium]|nr:tetratricopeptide repeat protein [Alcanivoracaceae bacterium]
MRLLLFIFFCSLSACQLLPTRQEQPADIKDASIDAQINPPDQDISVIETVPLMNNAVISLFKQAQSDYQNNSFEQAIGILERAYEIQPNSSPVTQLLAEIYLHKGDFKQAHYWASIATKSGPSKGKSCEKSWRILALSAQQLGYYAHQEKALNQKQNCLVKAAQRY